VPAVRDPKATSDRILKAATREFAAKGVAGARVDAIATRAKANKRMLYHYFGSKSDLFREVLRRELTERVNRSRERGGTRLERLVERQATHAKDRDWVRLLLWEGLDPRTAAASDPEREQWYREWVEGMRADQAAGLLPADLDVAQLALSELALTMFPAAFPQLTRWITGRSVTDPAFVAERQAFLAALGPRLYA
jgi:AcrR family transcriptional regulator